MRITIGSSLTVPSLRRGPLKSICRGCDGAKRSSRVPATLKGSAVPLPVESWQSVSACPPTPVELARSAAPHPRDPISTLLWISKRYFAQLRKPPKSPHASSPKIFSACNLFQGSLLGNVLGETPAIRTVSVLAPTGTFSVQMCRPVEAELS